MQRLQSLRKNCSPQRACLCVALLLSVGVFVAAGSARAQSWGGLYNMNQFLNEPHPFAPAPAVVPAHVAAPAQSRPTPASVRPSTYASPSPAASTTSTGSWSWTDIFSEVRVGMLMHDTGPFSANEEDGVDSNLELLFASPKIFSFMWSPRPQIGVSLNSSGDTSQGYAGLYWERSFWDGWFAGLSLGGMIHDGRLYGDKDGQTRKSLGCRFLFREAINFGYRFKKRHAILVHFDHSSNASLCEKNTPDGTANGRHDVVLNEGIESLGVRYGYMF